jgi:putative ABC transport system permease protein
MFRDLFHEAYDAMRHNRRRTALTMLGMGWGIATVVMLLAYGDGFGRAFANIFANFGTKLTIVVPGKTSTQAGGQKSARARCRRRRASPGSGSSGCGGGNRFAVLCRR